MSTAKYNRIAAVIARHERAQQEVKRLKKAIGEAVALCPISIKTMDMSASLAERDALIDVAGGRYRTKTHLWEALNEAEEINDWGGTRRLHADEIAEYLHDSGCQHCIHAWALIIQRKAARQELGSAKRAIRNIGRALIKHEVKP